jgi:hypothetical protein
MKDLKFGAPFLWAFSPDQNQGIPAGYVYNCFPYFREDFCWDLGQNLKLLGPQMVYGA